MIECSFFNERNIRGDSLRRTKMHVNHWVQNAVIRRVRHIMCFSCRSCFSYCRFSASSADSSCTII